MDAQLRNHSEKPSVKYTLKDFDKEFPDDAACLEWLVGFLYPNGIHCETCGKVTKHHKVKSRKSYSCDHCGHHVHPTAGTIYHKSSTSLRVWFQAIYLMSATRCGISAKQLERSIGVTYKTAWRMFKQIRSMLGYDGDPLDGKVEMDETYQGGNERGTGKRGRGTSKRVVFGMAQRGGSVIATKVPNAKSATMLPLIREYVLPSATIFTDEYISYNPLTRHGYSHHRIRHERKIWVMGDVHTNTIEGFWSLLKRGIDGVYHSVSDKYLQSYLDEYSFRYNNRKAERPMFSVFMEQTSSPNAEVANLRIVA